MKNIEKRKIIFTILMILPTLTIAQQNFTRVGKMNMQVVDYNMVKAKLDSCVNAENAYILEEAETKFSTKINNEIIIRVPNENFNSLVASLHRIASYVQSKEVEVVDPEKQQEAIQQQIAAKMQTRKKYTELLSNSKSVINVGQAGDKVDEINNEIKNLELKLKLCNETTYSTLNISMFENLLVYTAPKQESAFDLSQTKVENYLKIFLYIFLPLVIAAIIFYYWYRNRKFRNKSLNRKNANRKKIKFLEDEKQ